MKKIILVCVSLLLSQFALAQKSYLAQGKVKFIDEKGSNQIGLVKLSVEESDDGRAATLHAAAARGQEEKRFSILADTGFMKNKYFFQYEDQGALDALCNLIGFTKGTGSSAGFGGSNAIENMLMSEAGLALENNHLMVAPSKTSNNMSAAIVDCER